MAETSTIFGFMKYVSATDILSDFKKTVDSYFVNSLIALKQALFFYFFCQIICFCISYYLVFCDIIVLGDIYACYNY